MIKPILFIAGAALAMPAFAQVASIESSNPAPKASKGGDPNRKICERIEKIGSRLATSTVCRTAAEWEELRQGHRHDTERVQAIVNQSPSN